MSFNTARGTLPLAAALVTCVAAGSAAYAKATVITFSCWGNQTVFDSVKNRIKIFEKQNPDIKVNFRVGGVGNSYLEQLTTWIAGGSGPDVFEVEYHTFWKFAQWGVLEDLASYIKADSAVAMNDFYDVCIDAGRYQKRQYGLPYDVSAVWVTFNKELFSQVGLPSPIQSYSQGKWNWATFREAAQKLSKRNGAKLERIGLALNWSEYLQMGWPFGAGGTFFNEDKTKSHFSGPASVESARFVNDMANKDQSMHKTTDDHLGAYVAKGKFGMFVGWTTMPAWLKANKAKFEFDLIPMPAGSKSDVIGAQIHSISLLKSSKHKKAAWKFARFLTGKDGYSYAIKDTYFSSTRHSLDSLYQQVSGRNGIEGIKFYPSAMRKTRLYEVTPRFPDVQAAFNAIMYPVWNGKADLVPSLQKVDKQVGEMLADSVKRSKK